MEVLNDVLGESKDREPPMRNIDGVLTQVRVRRLPNMHALTPTRRLTMTVYRPRNSRC
jgi:hypothetical protein